MIYILSWAFWLFFFIGWINSWFASSYYFLLELLAVLFDLLLVGWFLSFHIFFILFFFVSSHLFFFFLIESSQFLSFCWNLFFLFSLSLSFMGRMICRVQYMGHVCMYPSGQRDGGAFSVVTPRPLLPAELLGKYSTLGSDRLHHRCHREHLVITSCARPPAVFTEPSASPVTRPCLCASLLETLDMLNTPIRPTTKLSTRNVSLRK